MTIAHVVFNSIDEFKKKISCCVLFKLWLVKGVVWVDSMMKTPNRRKSGLLDFLQVLEQNKI